MCSDFSAAQTVSLPVSPIDKNKRFIPPLKHPLLPSLTPNSPLPSIEYDPSNVVVDPPLPSSYEVLYSSPSPNKVPSGICYSSLSPRVLIKSNPVPGSPFQSSSDSVWLSKLSNYDDDADALFRSKGVEAFETSEVRKFFLLHPDQYDLLPSDTISKIPDLSIRKVYFCHALNHIVTTEPGEFENPDGVPAPEFDWKAAMSVM